MGRLSTTECTYLPTTYLPTYLSPPIPRSCQPSGDVPGAW